MAQSPKSLDLREACIAEAFKIISDVGIESLSLREVARRLDVSHQAPYRHFPSRDHILAEILTRLFDEFSAELESRPRRLDPYEDLRSMGEAYLRYALEHPLKYRLLFNTPMPDPAQHPLMLANAQRAFSLLHEKLSQMHVRDLPSGLSQSQRLDALFIWSTLHGLASILHSEALHAVKLTEVEKSAAIDHCFARLALAIETP